MPRDMEPKRPANAVPRAAGVSQRGSATQRGNTTQPNPRRWRRRLIVLTLVLGAVILLHAPLLRGVAGFLIVDEPLQKADFVVVLPTTLGNQDARQAAVQLYRDGTVHGILVLAPEPSRPVRYGAWADPATLFRTALIAQGIPASAVTDLPDRSGDWNIARRLSEFAAGRKDSRLIMLSPRFYGRYAQHMIKLATSSQPSLQIHLSALPSDFDRDNWWQSRVGFQEIFHQYAKLVFVAVYGDSTPCTAPWDYEDFERSLPAPEADP